MLCCPVLSLFQGGKVHFGYIYGFGVVGSLGIYLMLNLMCENGPSGANVVSVLGYALLPVCALGVLDLFLNLNWIFGYIAAAVLIGWSTTAATKLLLAKLKLADSTWLIAYPVLLFYVTFALLAIF